MTTARPARCLALFVFSALALSTACADGGAPADAGVLEADATAPTPAPALTEAQRQQFERFGPRARFWTPGDARFARHDVAFVAYNELGRHPQSDAFREIYHNSNQEWCSEFVSWVYRHAAAPFTGGGRSFGFSNADWQLETTGEIIRYFRERGAWADAGPGARAPRLGDYAYVEGPGGFKHSALVLGVVREADGGETLRTLEGNHRGAPVTMYAYPRWREGRTTESRVVGLGYRDELTAPAYDFPLTSHWFTSDLVTVR
jgi:hypothetical protein